MSDAKPQPDRNTVELWKYVSLDQYARPKSPAGETVRKGFLGLWDKLQKGLAGNDGNDRSVDHPYVDQALLHSVPRQLLDDVAPEPSWNDLTVALDEALEERSLNGSPASHVQFVVLPSCSGTDGVLLHWSMIKKWQIITPPDPAEIFHGGQESLAPLRISSSENCVIPHLERWYMRHHDGLTVIRKLIALLAARAPRCVIGVNSWSWAYLNKVLNLGTYFQTPLILQALDQQRLTTWLKGLAGRAGGKIFVFRQTDSGNLVLPLPSARIQPDTTESAQQQMLEDSVSAKTTKFTWHLANYARGIPLVAWAIWRYCLRSTQPAVTADEDDQLAKALRSDDEHTVWLKPWSATELPAMPGKTNNLHIFTLHTLLLHGQLEIEWLAHLLPFSTAEILTTLKELASLQLIELEKGMWRVAPLGYPSIRNFLQREGYLLDSF